VQHRPLNPPALQVSDHDGDLKVSGSISKLTEFAVTVRSLQRQTGTKLPPAVEDIVSRIEKATESEVMRPERRTRA